MQTLASQKVSKLQQHPSGYHPVPAVVVPVGVELEVMALPLRLLFPRGLRPIRNIFMVAEEEGRRHDH